MNSFSQELTQSIVASWIPLQLCIFLFSIFTAQLGCLKKQKKTLSSRRQGQQNDAKTATKTNDLSMKEPTSLCSCSNPSSMSMSGSAQKDVVSCQVGKDGKCCCTSTLGSLTSCLCAFGSNQSTTSNADGLNFDFQPNKNPRKSLPYEQIHGGGISLWDIAKRQLPIHAFEPLSILQAACEELRFAGRFLNKYNDVKAADERMLLVIGFIVSGYTGLVGRNRKPFNPLLGETFDFIHEDGWKYHAEQVSHHPPVSACYACGPDQKWQWFQTLHPKLMPSLDSMTVQPLLPNRLKFSNGDEYSWNKVAATIQNVRSEAEKRRVCNEGKMTISSNTGLEAEINFMNDGQNSLEGEVRQGDKVLHQLTGNWDKGIFRLKDNNERVALFLAESKDEDQASRQYGFNSFTIQLNELQQRDLLPPTDSRFRPDVRHLENAEAKRAEVAKKELEQAQRTRESGGPHSVCWFGKELDPFTNQQLWLHNGKYFHSKASRFQDEHAKHIKPLFPTESSSNRSSSTF